MWDFHCITKRKTSFLYIKLIKILSYKGQSLGQLDSLNDVVVVLSDLLRLIFILVNRENLGYVNLRFRSSFCVDKIILPYRTSIFLRDIVYPPSFSTDIEYFLLVW